MNSSFELVTISGLTCSIFAYRGAFCCIDSNITLFGAVFGNLRNKKHASRKSSFEINHFLDCSAVQSFVFAEPLAGFCHAGCERYETLLRELLVVVQNAGDVSFKHNDDAVTCSHDFGEFRGNHQNAFPLRSDSA